MIQVPLTPAFRYVHEPLPAGEPGIPFLGHEEVIARLQDRLRFSAGGAALITGFRGAGKTTVVRQALAGLGAGPGAVPVLPVFLNLARPVSPTALLFEIVRRLYETMVDVGLLGRIGPELAEAITFSYARTSLSFKQSQSRATEDVLSASLGGELGGALPAGPVRKLVPMLGASRKRTTAAAREATYLAYTDTDVEHDFIRILALLAASRPVPRRAWQRLFERIRRRRADGPPPQVVIVLDELDKLTASEDGAARLDELLAVLKNVVTSRGAYFLFIGGADLHDRWLRDVRRGNSIYESTFAWHLYVPCLWDAPGRLVRALARMPEDGPAPQATTSPAGAGAYPAAGASEATMSPATAPPNPTSTLVGPNPLLERIERYLEFKGRGIPRRLLHEFNLFVRWEGSRPRLEFGEFDLERLDFYGELESGLRRLTEPVDPAAVAGLELELDRWRLGVHYIVDHVLATGGATFTIAELLASAKAGGIDPALGITEAMTQAVVEHLAAMGVLEALADAVADAAVVADVRQGNRQAYRVARWVQRKLGRFARGSETERADLGAPPPPPVPTGFATQYAPVPAPSEIVEALAGRYRLVREIGRGGMAVVYEGVSQALNAPVALKVLSSSLWSDVTARERFEREAELARRVSSHPAVVRTFDFVSAGAQGPLILVMELLQGRTLRDIMAGPMAPKRAVAYALALLEGVIHVHAQGIVRLDIKPANVLVVPRRGPVLIDLGIARAAGTGYTTIIGTVVGTPAYMAPEQLRGDAVDACTDVYAVGLLLYELLAGSLPWGDAMGPELFKRLQEPQAVPGGELSVTPALRDVILRATATDPRARHQSAAELRDALLDTPEGNRAAAAMPTWEEGTPPPVERTVILGPYAPGRPPLRVDGPPPTGSAT